MRRLWKSFLATVDDVESEEALTRGYEEAGYTGAMRRLAETAAARSRRTRTNTMDVAALYLRAGENDLVLDWLERAFVDRDPNLPAISAVPLLDSVRDDPRFQDLLRRNEPSALAGRWSRPAFPLRAYPPPPWRVR